MKKNILKIALILSIVLLPALVKAQQVNSLYFLDNVPTRHYLNPAFQPLNKVYVSLPVIGYTQAGIMNNSLSLSDAVYNKNGQTILALNPYGDKKKFLNTLKDPMNFRLNAETNILGFGFRSGSGYWTFAVTAKAQGGVALSKDLARLAIEGTGTQSSSTFNLSNLGMDVTVYGEAAIGYSRMINDKLTVGGKLKYLYGIANMSTANEKLNLYTGVDKWTLNGKGSLNISSPAQEVIVDDKFDPQFPDNASSWAKPSGMGGAIDLGAVFKPIDALTLSVAINDLGFIRWNGNAKNLTYNVDYEFTGLLQEDTDLNDMSGLTDSIVNGIKNSFNYDTGGNKPYTTKLNPKFNIGAEYGLWDNKLSFGLLYHHQKNYNDLMAAITGRPANWANMSVNYSILNGKFSSVGVGLGLRTGFINWNIATDYLSFNNVRLPLESSSIVLPIPYKTQGLNLSIGFNLVFGNRNDKDKDGVLDKYDLCPETPRKVIVDKDGCPVDSDGDGTPDYLDKCPDTPREAYGHTDEYGCLKDSDGDGVYDYIDRCADTPSEAYKHIDQYGCPLDSDGDGVPDYIDECPDTPREAFGYIDQYGCPLDSDGDGVLDYLDKCPNTPSEAHGSVDKDGCPADSDGDGVPDYMDECPNTPKEAQRFVDEKGCPLDTDGDGVFDYMDDCPKVKGEKSNRGCPEVKKEVRSLFQKALQGIQFETGKDVIKKTSFGILDQIAKVLVDNPTYRIEIQGHTDNVGKAEANQILSEKRAVAVREYFINKGIYADRMTSVGYGDTKPVVPNTTAANKAKNRRVEFVVSFEEVSFQ